MAAHAIANELKKPFLALNYSEIESKFVGEAPKNLHQAFKQAKEDGAVLFFDEADSFLGKRIENVSSGSEQAINSLRSQMLILLEEFEGVVIFATNLVENFDKAFESRILKHLKFDLPNLEARAEIIKNKIPKKLPLLKPFNDDEFIKFGGFSEGLSGREIKGVILETLLKKAMKDEEKSIFEFSDFQSAFENKIIERKELLDESQKKIKMQIENALEKKFKKDEKEKLEIYCKFGFHVIWADGVINDFEMKALENFIVSNKLDLKIPQSIEELDSLKELCNGDFSKEDRINILDMMIKTYSVGYDTTESSSDKIKEIMTKLSVSADVIEEISSMLNDIKSSSFRFQNLIKKIE